MKRLIYIPLFLIIVFACAENNDAERPVAALPTSDSKWLLTETEQLVNGKKVWVAVSTLQPEFLVFRYDGMILNGDGKASCCYPKNLLINNTSYEVKPQSAVSYTSDCSSVICAPCPIWDIEMKGSEMIIAQCQNPRNKYVRQP